MDWLAVFEQEKVQFAILSKPQWIAGDRQIHCTSAGSPDPAGADCGVLIPDRRTDRDLVEMLRRRRGWVVDFEDKESVIFMRRVR